MRDGCIVRLEVGNNEGPKVGSDDGIIDGIMDGIEVG